MNSSEVDYLLERFLARFFSIPTKTKFNPNVTFSQMRVFMALKYGKKLKQCDLARVLNVTAASACELCSKMLEAGFIRQQIDESDRRIKWLYLTHKGKEMLRTLSHYRSERIGRLFKAVKTNRSQKFVDALNHLNEVLD
ncbi:MAG: MarR family transcriptional regulator, partial [Planctomycetes bacterium]|nr:MarR family transcriptional regulator [Planctomycetota bacterium]